MTDELIDLEEYSKSDKTPPKGKSYQIRVNKQKYVVHVESMTGREILQLANLTPPENYLLDQLLRGGQEKRIGLDEKVDFTTPGIERFLAQKTTHQDGEELRRQFKLSSEDEQYIERNGLQTETISSGDLWLLIHDFLLPDGYNVKSATAAIRIVSGYPDAPLDMIYFFPKLELQNGRLINALSDLPIDGKMFQQWSRHRTGDNPWIAGQDNLETHIKLMRFCLEKETKQ